MSLRNRNILDIKKKAGARSSPVRRAAYTPAEKVVRLRTRKRRQRIMAFCVCVLCGAGLLAGLGGASRLERLAITHVDVVGAQDIPAESLAASVTQAIDGSIFKVFSRKNIFIYPRTSVERSLAEAFPRIKDVSLSRPSLLAQAVVVNVDERETFARWCAEPIEEGVQTCFEMDSTGFIFAESGGSSQPRYVFRGGLIPDMPPIGQTFLRARFEAMRELLDAIATTGVTPTGVTVLNEKDFSVELSEGFALYSSFDADAATVVRNLKDALESDVLKNRTESLSYIDLRFGNRVYFK